MKFINLSICILITAGAWATEYAPWFTPPLEFQGRVGGFYTHSNTVTSPLGNFSEKTSNASLHTSLGVTPWPAWNIEAELYFTHATHTAFNYEAALLTLRYAWLDDIQCDFVSLVTGVTFSFPSNHFLHEFAFPYHGNVNGEFHTTIGKEWACGPEWKARFWWLLGLGCANKGSPWFHTVALFEYRLLPPLTAAIFTEALYGFGHHNIIPHTPFRGYASINHQNITLGSYLDYEWCLTTFRLLAWHSLHTHNFIANHWGLSLSLLIPFWP